MDKIRNEHGIEISFDIAVELMNDEIRESLNEEMAPCSEQDFFDAYCQKHMEVFNEVFELAKANPVY